MILIGKLDGGECEVLLDGIQIGGVRPSYLDDQYHWEVTVSPGVVCTGHVPMADSGTDEDNRRAIRAYRQMISTLKKMYPGMGIKEAS